MASPRQRDSSPDRHGGLALAIEPSLTVGYCPMTRSLSNVFAKYLMSLVTSKISLDPISEFYNAHPYPPPLENLDRARDEWREENRQRAEYHLLCPENRR